MMSDTKSPEATTSLLMGLGDLIQSNLVFSLDG